MIENKLIRLQAIMTKHCKAIKKIHHKQLDVVFSLHYDASSDSWMFEYRPYLGTYISLEGKDLEGLLDKAEKTLRCELPQVRNLNGVKEEKRGIRL